MAKYAANTKVPPERSAEEVKAVLRKHKAQSIGTLESADGIMVVAQLRARNLKFQVPKQKDAQEYARKWRVLLIRVKAALDDLDEIRSQSDFDEKMLSWIVLPNGQTVGEFAREGVAIAYANGTMPTIGIEYKPAEPNVEGGK